MSVSYGGDKITFDDGSSLSTGYTHFRNRIINGDMRIAQRTTSSQTVNSSSSDVYPVDRFHAWVNSPSSAVLAIQRSSDVPTGQGFANSTVISVSTADGTYGTGELSGFRQIIEAYNIEDLQWGTVNAKAASLSFWTKSSVTGTHSGVIANGDWTRTYGFTFTISSANTWQYVKIENVPGETTGSWGGSSNGRGIQIVFNLGAESGRLVSAGSWTTTSEVSIGVTGSIQLTSTLNANLYITGVQFEVGSYATTFERRPFGTELALCQRYFQKSYQQSDAVGTVTQNGMFRMYMNGLSNFTVGQYNIFFKTSMRTLPTVVGYSPETGASGKFRDYNAPNDKDFTSLYTTTEFSSWQNASITATTTPNIGAQWTANAEL